MSVINKIHNLSLHILTLCGFGALICLAVNVATALVMFLAELNTKKQTSAA